ncbi:MAG TPA: MDR family oxidoreductase [Alphaproteobacteria bacterium]|nr:MDR family oxidoreductase [Alphaproteobacteria bacterium]
MADFRALVLDERDGKVTPSLKTVSESELPPGDVTVAVSHSTLNYKDGMILAGLGRIVRKYPHVPGIDFAGMVESSASPAFKPGDKVVLTGWRVGEWYWGGYAQKARVKAEWLVPLPSGMSPQQAMAIGTAGFTAMLAVMALERHGLKADAGEVLVTGAGGGVGSVAVAILAKLGYQVAASTGRAETHDHLKHLGAATILNRAETTAPPGKPLVAERWQGCVDTVGGAVLAGVLPAVKYNGSVAACGNAGGNDVPANILPFLLRGVSLLGIDSAVKPMPERREAWSRLTRDLPLDKLDAMTTVVRLDDVLDWGGKILKGQVRGRVVIDLTR